MSRRFGSPHDFVEIHDEVAVICKWAHNDKIYLGSLSGSLLELSSTGRQFSTNYSLPIHSLAVSDVAISDDNRYIVTTSLDGTCVICSTEFGAESELRRDHEIECPDAVSPHCAISSSGDCVAIVGCHGSLYVNNLITHDTAQGKLSDEFFKAVSFYGDEQRRIVCLARHHLALVDVESRETIRSLMGATPTTPGKLRKSVNCLATHSGQQLVAVGTVAGYIEFYDFDRTEERVLEPLKVGGQIIESMEFSYDGQTLVVAGSNKRISLFDVGMGTVTHYVELQRSRILSVSFDQFARKIVSVSEDKTVVIAPVTVAAQDVGDL
jgi:WD40 repeat protein